MLTPAIFLDDPFRCGVGFLGEVSGGVGPYKLLYVLDPVDGGSSIGLGTFVVPAAGDFVSPANYLDPVSGVSADFNVTIGLVDAAGTELVLRNAFVAQLRSPCTISTASSVSPALNYPGPFTNAPPSGLIGGGSAAVGQSSASDSSTATNSTATNSTATSSTTADSASAPLAVTGAEAPLFASISVVLLTMGGALLVASRREKSAGEL